MTNMELFNIVTLVVGVGTPCCSIAYFLGSIKPRLKSIEDNQCRCVASRESAEKDLYDKANANAKDIARIKGRMNGDCHDKDHK